MEQGELWSNAIDGLKTYWHLTMYTENSQYSNEHTKDPSLTPVCLFCIIVGVTWP